MAMQVFHNPMQLSVNLLQQPVMALARILPREVILTAMVMLILQYQIREMRVLQSITLPLRFSWGAVMGLSPPLTGFIKATNRADYSVMK